MTDNESSASSSIANPAGLGLLAFGMTTMLLAFCNLGLIGLDSTVLSMGIFYGGLAQIIAGIFEFKKGNTFGATAFTSYGFFWLVFVALKTDILPALPAADSTSMGFFFLMWGIMTLFLFIGTLKSPRTLQIVFFTLTLLFFVVSAENFAEFMALKYVAGIIGVVCAGTAIYTALGQVINEQHGRTVLPLG